MLGNMERRKDYMKRKLNKKTFRRRRRIEDVEKEMERVESDEIDMIL